MKKVTFYIVSYFLFTCSVSPQVIRNIQTEVVNGWYIVDTLNVWEASSRINTFGGVPQATNGNNYQIFRLKTYDAGKPSYVEFEKKIPKIKTPIGLFWYAGLVNMSPASGYSRYLFSIGDSSGWCEMKQPYQFGGESFMLIEWEGYFDIPLPDSIDRIKIHIYPAPYSGNIVRFIELGFDFLRGVKNEQSYPRFLIDPFEDTTVVGVEDEPSIPKDFHLFQNYPNPFNPGTKIRFELLSTKFVKLQVFDILGREVVTLVNEEKQAGMHEVKFDARGLSSGVYIYTIAVGDKIFSGKMILSK